jgi:hypothetical protein
LRRLNRSGRSDAVVQAFETGGVECTEASFGEYMKVIVLLKVQRLATLQAALQNNNNSSNQDSSSNQISPATSPSKMLEPAMCPANSLMVPVDWVIW